jgi:hypothetical protein
MTVNVADEVKHCYEHNIWLVNGKYVETFSDNREKVKT